MLELRELIGGRIDDVIRTKDNRDPLILVQHPRSGQCVALPRLISTTSSHYLNLLGAQIISIKNQEHQRIMMELDNGVCLEFTSSPESEVLQKFPASFLGPPHELLVGEYVDHVKVTNVCPTRICLALRSGAEFCFLPETIHPAGLEPDDLLNAEILNVEKDVASLSISFMNDIKIVVQILSPPYPFVTCASLEKQGKYCIFWGEEDATQ